jgi:hypothetical protein
MKNIVTAQSHIRDFVAKTILPTYKFNDWKESLVLSRTKQTQALLDKWDLFGKSFVPIWIEPDMIVAGDWVPGIMLTYKWRINNAEIPVRFTIANMEIQYVEITDMFKVAELFGDQFDFVNEFEKSVVLIKLLSK